MQKCINSFPGYEFKKLDDGKYHNMYRGVDLGLGGYVYANPGIYYNVALIDAASMHPTSIVMLNKLGEYTQRYADLRAARVFIKHKDYESAGKLFGGALKKYLTNDEEAKELSKALKLPLNAFFGISFANYDNPARDKRDINNIIALRGALFMKTLQDEVTAMGYTVVHIKTDSIKVANADDKIISFVQEFGKKYGYEMEHEATYKKICLVNDAVYIAQDASDGHWTATGTQFQVPYVFKTLFSHEPIEFDDMCETKSVSTALYLDMNENLPDETHDYHFIGKVGRFCPILPGHGGGLLMREKDGKYYAATGTKGFRWLESEMVKKLRKECDIDYSYYYKLVNDAEDAINNAGAPFGIDYSKFVDDNYIPLPSSVTKVATDEEVPFH